MKINYLLLAIVFVPLTGFSQGRTNLWYMGYPGGGGGITMDFSSGSMNIFAQPRIMPFEETIGIISDEQGNFLFSSNGVFIMNANNDTMQNGSGLNPSWYTTQWENYGLLIIQGNLIIPIPSDSMRYYLFHETVESPQIIGYIPYHLYYSIIDMSLNNFLGEVTQKNMSIISDTLDLGAITSVKHANGRDWWVVIKKRDSNRFYKILVTNSGMYVSFQDIGNVRTDWNNHASFSFDGSKYALYCVNNDLDIFDFDRCSGLFSNYQNVLINDSGFAWGCSFSSNSKFLYVSTGYHVYQFDVLNANISNSKITVADWDSTYSPNPPLATGFFLSQLAKDGKIYVNCPNSTDVLHVINFPDSAGLSCDLVQHGIQLPALNAFTMVNFPNYYLGAITGSICDSLTGVSEVLPQIKFNIKPNPVTNGNLQINYLLPQNASGVFNLIDINGAEVFSYNLPQWSTYQSFDVSGLANGIYVAEITSKGIKSYTKVGIMR